MESLYGTGVIDLFCGIGGLSYGLKERGLTVIAGFDIDSTCKFAYEENNKAAFFPRDIREVTSKQIKSLWSDSIIRILVGCAPCQPFSSYSNGVEEKDSSKYDLLYEFGRIVEETLPDIISMENVPQIASFKVKAVLQDFVSKLHGLGYQVSINKVYCPDYGIPQTRKRLILLASRLGTISLIAPTHTAEKYVTVRDTISNLTPIEAGERDIDDPLHVARALSPINLKRIKNTPYGGSWVDWSDDLKLECHKRESGKSYASVYGRMLWDEPSPTMTTLCTGFGNGRFGHPVQDRAISVREAALLQTFPTEYKFFEDAAHTSIRQASRAIGNAVPPKLGAVIADSIITHLKHVGF